MIEIIMYVLCGLIIGFAAGFFTAVWGQCKIDEAAVETKRIKLCGRYFYLIEIPKWGRGAEE